MILNHAGVAELADAHDSKSCSLRSVGSIPTTGTNEYTYDAMPTPVGIVFLWVTSTYLTNLFLMDIQTKPLSLHTKGKAVFSSFFALN